MRTNLGWKRVCRDDLRRMMHGASFDPRFEILVSFAEQDMVRMLIDKGYHVIVDATHLRAEYIKRWRKFCTTYFPWVEVVIKDFPITLESAIMRNLSRPAEEQVPEPVIRRMWMQWQAAREVKL